MITNQKILVVSNESDLTKVLEENLASCGYRVTSTGDSGEELRELIEMVSPDLVVIGMAISCIEAVELTLRIRTWCQVPIILVRSWGIASELLDQDGMCSLTKQYNISDLLLKIKTTCSSN